METNFSPEKFFFARNAGFCCKIDIFWQNFSLQSEKTGVILCPHLAGHPAVIGQVRIFRCSRVPSLLMICRLSATPLLPCGVLSGQVRSVAYPDRSVPRAVRRVRLPTEIFPPQDRTGQQDECFFAPQNDTSWAVLRTDLRKLRNRPRPCLRLASDSLSLRDSARR